MTTTELAPVRAEQATGCRFVQWRELRRYALGLYFLALIAWSAHYGVPVQRELVIAWVCGALACACIGRHPREMLWLIIDWAPMVIVLAAYDMTRGVADRLGIKEVDDGIWLVSFMRYDLGYFDLEQKTLQPLDTPFGTRLSPMS